MTTAQILCAVLLLAAVVVALWDITRMQPDARQAERVDTADELLRIERDLAEHGSLGRNFADRELV